MKKKTTVIDGAERNKARHAAVAEWVREQMNTSHGSEKASSKW